MVSNHCWCSALWNRCLSKSISSCGTALEPSPVVSFLDLFVGGFLEPISCEDTFVKSVLQEIIFYHKKKKTNRAKVAFTSSQQNTYVNMNLDKTLHINAWVISRNTYIYSHISLLVKNISWGTPLPLVKELCHMINYPTYMHSFKAFCYPSKTYMLQGILATYHTYILQGICILSCIHIARHFATYLYHFEWHFLLCVHIYSHISSYTWEATSYYVFTHICFWRAIFMLYSHSWKEIFMSHIHTYIHLKSDFYVTYSHFWKAIFMSYVHILRSSFVPYVHICTFCKALGYLSNIHMLYLKGICLLLPILYIHVHGEQHFHII